MTPDITTVVAVAYGVGALVSWPIMAGWYFAHARAVYPSVYSPAEELGNALALGLAGGLVWPLMLPAAYLVTGFAEHGWRLR